MKIIFGINKIRKYKKAVVALGVFDGLHRGHRNILQSAVSKAGKINGTSIVLTFFPHPQKKESLYSLDHRLKLIAELGIDICIVINFSQNFAKMRAEDFIKNILVKKIGASFVYTGKNFRFGNKANGDYRLLGRQAKKYNFKLECLDVIKSKGLPISSTVIRKLIKNSEIKEAENLLGRRVSVLGSVIRGSKLARVLGFPTANINPHHEVVPPPGIYAVQIKFCAKIYNGICYIGARPTFYAKDKSIHIEVHIFDFHKNIYSRYLEIQFIKLIRPEEKFASIQELSLAVAKDVIFCRKLLKRYPLNTTIARHPA